MNHYAVILAYFAIVLIGVAASVTDLRTQRIPNMLTGAAMLFGLLFWLVAGLAAGNGLVGEMAAGRGALVVSLLGLLCGLIPFGILVSMGGLGGGDMKLMAAIGAWSANWKVVLGTTIYALIVAVVIAIALIIRHGRVRLTLYRLFGIALSKGKAITPDDDANAPKVPFAVAAAIGAALAGAEHMLGLWNPPLW